MGIPRKEVHLEDKPADLDLLVRQQKEYQFIASDPRLQEDKRVLTEYEISQILDDFFSVSSKVE